jgi:hypothetical protein
MNKGFQVMQIILGYRKNNFCIADSRNKYTDFYKILFNKRKRNF